jgi:hypothetical protein
MDPEIIFATKFYVKRGDADYLTDAVQVIKVFKKYNKKLTTDWIISTLVNSGIELVPIRRPQMPFYTKNYFLGIRIRNDKSVKE